MHDEIDERLLQRIPTLPGRTSTPELIDDLRNCGHELVPRAVQKRLVGLANHYDLVCHDSSKPFQWSWPKGAKQKVFKSMAPYEALSLLLARAHLHALLPPRTLAWVDERLEVSEREVGRDQSGKPGQWRMKVRRVPNDLPRVPPKVDAQVFKRVSEALYDGLQLALRYRKRFVHEPAEYTVHPLGLCEREGELWLVARKQEEDGAGALRFFLVHRMLEAKVLHGRVAVAPVGFNLDTAIAEGLAHFPLELGSEMQLVARFHANVVEKLDESPLAANQVLEELEDGWFRLRATVPHTRALQSFLLGYGSLCVVESPLPLREAIAGDLKTALAGYAS